MSKNYLSAALKAAAADLERPLAVIGDDHIETYGDSFALAAQLAQALVERGVQPGDRIAAQVDKSWPAFVLYLAAVRVGAVYIPLNTAYTINELEYFLSDASPTVFVCRPEIAAEAKELGDRLRVAHVETMGVAGAGSLLDAARAHPSVFDDVPRGADDLCAILYTSGTTGRAKGAMLSHANLLSNAAALKTVWRFSQDDVLLHALPIFHMHGLFIAANVVLLAGASMQFRMKFDASDATRLMASGRVTAMMGVPTFYTRLLDDPAFTRDATSSMRLFVSGSAPLLAETHKQFEERSGHSILERYGMTEAGIVATNPYEGPRIAGTVGKALPGVDLRTVDPESGQELPVGEIGMVEARGPNVFQGYWRMPEKTASEFHDGFFVTGDLGKFDSDGYLHIVGRNKDLIISGGFNVYPKEVELEIDAIEGVVESAVIGVPHRDFGEGVTAVVVLEKGAVIGPDEIRARLEQRLAKFKLPKKVFLVSDLPRNSMGKVQKNVLREAYAHTFGEAMERSA